MEGTSRAEMKMPHSGLTTDFGADEAQQSGKTMARTRYAARIWRILSALVDRCTRDSKNKTSPSKREQEVLERFRRLGSEPLESALAQIKSTGEPLEESEAAERLATHGLNQLSSTRRMSWLYLLIQGLINPFNALLATLSIIAISTGDASTFSILMVMVVLSTSLRFYQELRSEEKISALKMLITHDCEVERKSEGNRGRLASRHTITIPCHNLVVGDIICLGAGSLLPADCIVLEAQMLTVSQSMLTGESVPVHKYSVRGTTETVQQDGKECVEDVMSTFATSISSVPTSAFEMPNLLFMGSHVVSGHAKAIVVNTADSTYIGQIASAMEGSRPTTVFQHGIRQLSIMLMAFMIIMAPIVLIIEGTVTHDWKSAGLFCLSVAVGLVPEMLPMVVNTNLARGAIVMAKKKVIAKRLDAIQNLGAVNVLCSDKTGTLTSDKIALSVCLNPQGQVDVRSQRLAYFNAVLTQGYENPIDKALISSFEAAEDSISIQAGPLHQQREVKLPRKVGEIPFDFNRRLVSVIYEDESEGAKGDLDRHPINRAQLFRHRLVCKGALEEVLRRCTSAHGCDGPLDIPAIMSLGEAEATKGKRVLGVASCIVFEEESLLAEKHDREDLYKDVYTVEHERNMTFDGILAFMDPPKEDAAESLAELMRLGLEIKVLTGDAMATARAICGTIGIVKNTEFRGASDESVDYISGPDLSRLGPDAFDEAVSRCKVFAKLTPIQKLDIVQSLRRQGSCVAFLGDGINDAPALRAADCGISVNTGSDVAKEAASIVLLEKSLHVVIEGVRFGRISSVNTLKYIKMAASSNFGTVFSLLYASAWLPFTPMTATQLLVQNLAYDISQSSIPWDNVDEEMVAQPCRWSTRSIARFVVCIGPLSSPFDFVTFASNWWLYKINESASPQQIGVFRTHWFLEGLLTQALIVHVLRTGHIPFVQSRASLPVTLTTSIICLIGIAIPYTPLGAALRMQRPEGSFYGILAACLLSYMLLVQVAKLVYKRLFKEWL